MEKKICFISHGLGGGGMERSLVSLANSFVNQGCEVTIINLYKTDIFFEVDSKIKIIWPETERNNKVLYILKTIPFLRRKIIIEKPDVVFGFGETFNWYVVIATRFIGLKRLVLTNRMWPSIKFGFPIDQANWVFYRFADGVIAQTNKAKELISVKSPNKNIIVIPNAVKPIDIEIIAKKKQIVTVGRISPAKGHTVLIKAFALLANNDWTLHIVGDGPDLQLLKEEALKLGISDKVIFHGHLKEFKHILAESSIFVLPSFFEGFPNALVEAMTIPLPCVSSNCIAGPSDIINDQINGCLFEPGNENQLAEILKQLISNEALRNQIATEAFKIRDTYEFNRIAEMYMRFLLNK